MKSLKMPELLKSMTRLMQWNPQTFFWPYGFEALRQHLHPERVYAATSRGGYQILIQMYWDKH
jgi:hypothetical protein